MVAALILWGHALAALLFVAAALGLRGRAPATLPRWPLGVALTLTALWALAVAGIDGRDVGTRAILALRDVAWLATMLSLSRRRGRTGGAVVALHVAALAIALIAAGIAVAAASVAEIGSPALVAALDGARLCLRALGILASLILVDRLQAQAGAGAPAVRLVAAALALMWGGDLVTLAAEWSAGSSAEALVALRGALVGVAGLLMAAAIGRADDRPLAMSRTVMVRLASILALAGYAAIVALLTAAADALGGEHARVAQTAIVFGATAALLALLSTPWLRAWAKVVLAKHLFSHRYDYRAEWQRFSETLACTPGAAAPLGERVAQAIADLTVSPAALLMVPDSGGLTVAASWRWSTAPSLAGVETLVEVVAAGRIVELDAERAGRGSAAEDPAGPAPLLACEEAWAIVPLAHRGGLVGAVLLARPPADRALDWEDFDLLRVAGRQAAGALAEDEARRALADAERFDEFNRRFAFILHDIKNLVSQHALVARNAERHADNPVFRADMIATLTESSVRMQALLARLSPQAARREPSQPVEVAALLGAVAARRRDAVIVDAPPRLWLLADRAALETVLDHLVQNAIEASATGRAVTLAATPAGYEVAITVIDRGTGMSATFVRDQLFRPFVSTKPGGFGLGAYEARQTIEAMGGRLEVASREGEGTRVVLRLPAAAALENAA